MTTSTFNAILSLKPGAKFIIAEDNGTETITWKDSSKTQPTDSEIAAEKTRLDTIEAYQKPRRYAYPSVGDQLDLLYKDILAGKVDATGEFAKAIKAVKDSIPKP